MSIARIPSVMTVVIGVPVSARSPSRVLVVLLEVDFEVDLDVDFALFFDVDFAAVVERPVDTLPLSVVERADVVVFVVVPRLAKPAPNAAGPASAATSGSTCLITSKICSGVFLVVLVVVFLLFGSTSSAPSSLRETS